MPRSTRLRLTHLALTAALAAGATSAQGATRAWPTLFGTGCTGTLQQCITDAAAGDTVRIVADDFLTPDAYTTVDENLVITKSLTLEAAPGIDAVFAPGRTLLVQSPTVGGVAVTLRRLVLRSGGVRIVHRGTDASSYTIDQLRIEEVAESENCAVDFQDRGAGAPSFVLGDSSFRFRVPQAFAPFGICAFGEGGPWQVSMFRNFLDSERGAVAAGITVTGTSSGTVNLGNNQIFLNGTVRGVSISQNPGSTANVLSIHDNLVTGQIAAPGITESAILVNPTNTDLRIVNNTVARNYNGLRIAYRDGNGSFGRVVNNLVAFNVLGLDIDPRYTTVANADNLVFGNTLDIFAPGPGTVAADPQFVAANDFRLRPTSPARDSGDNADVPSLFGVAFDADGERRIADGTVDLGAFEVTGDYSVRQVASAANTVDNYTQLDGFPPLGFAERLMLTPLRGPITGPELAETLGIFQDVAGTNFYYAFHEDQFANLSPGRRFHALAPLGGATAFLHTTTSGSVVDAYSRISHPALDSNPSAIAFVVHHWNPGGGVGIYHDHRVGLDYAAPNWFVGNQDAEPMPSGRAFNIVVAPTGSPNAFVRPVGGTARAELRLEHPLLDDNECATLQVGRSGSTFNDTAFSLEYRAGGFGAPGHWFIVAEGSGSPSFPANTAFNVMVSGTQANACRTDRVFVDGFE